MDWKAVFKITKAKVIAFIILEVIMQILIVSSVFLFISKPICGIIKCFQPQSSTGQLWLVLTLLSTTGIVLLIYLITFLYKETFQKIFFRIR